MREIYLPVQGGGAVRTVPKLYRTSFEAMDNVKLLQANLASLQVEIDESRIDPSDSQTMYDLMNNSDDRRTGRARFATLWQREAVIRAQLEVATMAAVPAYKAVGGVVLSSSLGLPLQRS